MSEVTADLFRAIAEYTYDWETWVDVAGATRWINGAVTRITGYSVEECFALPDFPLALACEADRPVLERVLADARAGGSGNDVEFRVCRKDGAQRWVAISWQSVHSAQERPLGYRTSIRDIDERKQMEHELHEIRRKAEALAQARSELLANVSHELRSPAHCIAGFADLLLAGPLADKQRHYVSIILDQCRSMQRQVEDLLSLTALEAGGVELARETVDLRVLVQGLIEVSQPAAQASGLELRAELRAEPPFVEADPLRLQQILRNLIDNALKFTERGSIVLSVWRSAEDAPRLCLEVADTGSGMDPDQVEQLLLPFRQGDASSTKRHGGVGLGLAIVQRLVSAMSGELTIETARGKGTRVRVSVPWIRASRDEPEAEPRHESPGSGRALVVDDSPAARELLSGLLEASGFSASTAASAEDALALVSREAFDVIFIDYQMPGSDGAEAALLLRRSLRAREPSRHVPIFILTANVFAHEQLRDARASVDGILAKPLSRLSLQHVLRQLPTPALAVDGAPTLDERVLEDLKTTPHRSGKSLFEHLSPQVERDIVRAYESAREALARVDTAALARAAHTLAGQAALLGAARAAARANELELAARAPQAKSDTLEPLLSAAWGAWLAAAARLRAQ